MTRARLGALALLVSIGSSFAWSLSAVAREPAPAADRGVLVVLVPAVSFEDLMADPDIARLATAGGAGLSVAPSDLGRTLAEGFGVGVLPLSTPTVDERLAVVKAGAGPAPEAELGRQVRALAERFAVGRLLVVVAGVSRSPEMVAAKDEQLPVVVAEGDPSGLFAAAGSPGSITSDSTRRAGVVTQEDIVPTILAFDGGRVPGHPLPAAGNGSPIGFADAPAPFDLHERYLAQRRMYVPVGAAAALYVTGVGLLAVGFLAAGRRVSTSWRRAAAWATLSVPMLATGMLAAGHLPTLAYATAVPMIAIVTVFGTMAFSPLERQDPTLVPAGIGLAVLGLAVLEAALFWTGMLTPLLGGSQLDGGRYFGLPNVAIGLLVGSGLWVAQRLRTIHGFWLLCGVGLFAGLPLLGTNLGGAVTSFAAAGMWLAIRERERLGLWRGLGIVVGATVVGTAVILVAHAISPIQTHITRFEEHAGGIGGILRTFGERLRVGVDLIGRSPAALVPVLGLPIVLAVLLRPPGVFRPLFERWPAWRDAAVVTIASGIVACVANDSGAAAAGLAFGLGLGGTLGMSLLEGRGKMVVP